MSYLSLFEWTGTILALLGAFILASKKIKMEIPYSMWIASNILYIWFFYNTGNHGLLAMNLFGILINSFGLYQWKKSHNNINHNLTNIISIISIIFLIASLVSLFLFSMNGTNNYLEWFGSLLGVGSAIFLSSRHRLSFLCWGFWTLANGVLIYIGLQNNQFGFVVLQIGFMLSNIYGGYVWATAFMKEHKIVQLETPTHS